MLKVVEVCKIKANNEVNQVCERKIKTIKEVELGLTGGTSVECEYRLTSHRQIIGFGPFPAVVGYTRVGRSMVSLRYGVYRA